MKKLLFVGLIFLIVLFQSCTVTKGVYDSSLKSTEPYKFKFLGDKVELETFLKRIVVQNGFGIQNFDSQAQILTTGYKDLSSDEIYNTNASMLFGATVSSQKGNLVFIYNAGDTGIDLEMSAFLTMNTQLSLNTYSKTDIANGSIKLQQGHPLLMKFRNLLLKDPKFTLKSL